MATGSLEGGEALGEKEEHWTSEAKFLVPDGGIKATTTTLCHKWTLSPVID